MKNTHPSLIRIVLPEDKATHAQQVLLQVSWNRIVVHTLAIIIQYKYRRQKYLRFNCILYIYSGRQSVSLSWNWYCHTIQILYGSTTIYQLYDYGHIFCSVCFFHDQEVFGWICFTHLLSQAAGILFYRDAPLSVDCPSWVPVVGTFFVRNGVRFLTITNFHYILKKWQKVWKLVCYVF